MFESTGWELEEPDVPDTTKFDLLVPSLVRPAEQNTTEEVACRPVCGSRRRGVRARWSLKAFV